MAENFLVGLLAFIFLAVVFCLAAAEFSLVYALVAFRMFFWGVAERAAKKRAKEQAAQAAQPDTAQALPADAPAQEAPKTHRAFDMFLFLFGLALSVGIIIAFIACFVAWA